MTDHEPRIKELKDIILGKLDDYVHETATDTEWEAEDIATNQALVEELIKICMDVPN